MHVQNAKFHVCLPITPLKNQTSIIDLGEIFFQILRVGNFTFQYQR